MQTRGQISIVLGDHRSENETFFLLLIFTISCSGDPVNMDEKLFDRRTVDN